MLLRKYNYKTFYGIFNIMLIFEKSTNRYSIVNSKKNGRGKFFSSLPYKQLR